MTYNHPLLNLFIDFARKRGIIDDVYVVGGAVREMLVGIETSDIDLAVAGDALEIAEEFSEVTGASCVLLDAVFRMARVVKESAFLDISPIRGGSIAFDLADRDITINAMAQPLSEWRSANVIDPFGGRKDLRSGVIRMVSDENLVNDPLRILRIYRFSASLHASIERNTRGSLKVHAALLRDVAAERIAEELRYIMALGYSHEIMKVMDEDDVLPVLFPELGAGEPGRFTDGISHYEQCEAMINNTGRYFPHHEKPVSVYFELPLRRICLKLVALFSGSDVVREVAVRLKMSRKEIGLAASFSAGCSRIKSIFRAGEEKHELIGFLKAVQADIYAAAILALALDGVTSPFLLFCNNVLEFHTGKLAARMGLLGLINGDDLIREFGLSPSPRFRHILSAVEDDILEGRINTRAEALQAAKKLINSQRA